MAESCPVCAGPRSEAFHATLLGRHRVAYHFCGGCGLLQTERPYWLDEAYASAIASIDVDLVARNLANVRRIATLLHFRGPAEGRHCDAAGGYGLLTRMLRDVGFDAYWDDPYCENLFARGFEAAQVPGTYASLSLLEVIEHVHDPVAFLSGTLERWQPQRVFLSTEVFEGTPPAPGRWDYYAPESGQHISFYQPRTIATIAARLGLSCYSRGSFHLLSRTPEPAWLTSLLSGPLSHLLLLVVRARRRSRTADDAASARRRANERAASPSRTPT